MDDTEPARPSQQAAMIRPVTPGDVPGLKALIDATGLFPSDMLDDMLAPSGLPSFSERLEQQSSPVSG